MFTYSDGFLFLNKMLKQHFDFFSNDLDEKKNIQSATAIRVHKKVICS